MDAGDKTAVDEQVSMYTDGAVATKCSTNGYVTGLNAHGMQRVIFVYVNHNNTVHTFEIKGAIARVWVYVALTGNQLPRRD